MMPTTHGGILVALSGLGAVLSLLLAACAPSTPVGQVAETPAPLPRATMPAVAGSVATPAPAAPSVVAPPAPTPRPEVGALQPVQESAPVSQLLREMDQFSVQLQDLYNGSPSSQDLIAVTGQMNAIMARVHQEIGPMTETERAQALRQASHLLDETGRVAAAYTDSTNVPGPAVSTGTPIPTSGVLLRIRPGSAPPGPPSALPTTAQRLDDQINLIRQYAGDMSRGRPTGEDVGVSLASLQSTITTMRQMSNLLSNQELDGLTASAAAAMQAIADVTRVYAGS